MEVLVLKEEGHELAIRGMSYSFMDRGLEVVEWWEGQREKAEKRSNLLAPKEGGHNSFLESITVWIDIEAARAWWSEMDRYRVGKTQLSQSTMHSLGKRRPTADDFEVDTPPRMIEAFALEWDDYQTHKSIKRLKCAMPEGYLQRRMVCTNYKVLRNILWQREGHRLDWWKTFSDAVLSQVQHPEYLRSNDKPVKA